MAGIPAEQEALNQLVKEKKSALPNILLKILSQKVMEYFKQRLYM